MQTTIDGVYIQFSTPTHQEAVFLGEVTIPVDHLFLEGTDLLKDAMVNQSRQTSHAWWTVDGPRWAMRQSPRGTSVG